MYAVYITFYKGNKLPPFYVGYTTKKAIENGYHGSVKSQEYKDIWKHEQKENPDLFKTVIISLHDTKEAALSKEEQIHLFFNVAENPLFTNKRNGNHQFVCTYHTSETKRKISESLRIKLNSPDFDKSYLSNSKGRKLGPQKPSTIKKLSKIRKGKPKSEEFKQKISMTLKGRLLRPRNTICKTWKITNVKTGKVVICFDRIEFCKENNIKYACFNVGTRNGYCYKKEWLCEKIG